MNTSDPYGISPLSFGPGLVLGLFLIIGLPAEKPPKEASCKAPPPYGGSDLATAGKASPAPPATAFLVRPIATTGRR